MAGTFGKAIYKSTSIMISSTTQKQFIKFFAVGVFTFCLYTSIYLALFSVAAFSALKSVVIAFATTTIVHFLCNKRFAFENKGKPSNDMLLRYIFLVITNYCIAVVITLLFEYLGLNLYFLTLVTSLTSMIFSFVIMKFFVFDSR